MEIVKRAVQKYLTPAFGGVRCTVTAKKATAESLKSMETAKSTRQMYLFPICGGEKIQKCCQQKSQQLTRKSKQKS